MKKLFAKIKKFFTQKPVEQKTFAEQVTENIQKEDKAEKQ